MKPFTMHAVLKYRQQLEDVARQNVHRALQQAARLQEALLRSEEELTGLHRDLQQESKKGITSDRLLLFERRMHLVQNEIIRRRKDFDKHQLMVTKKRQQLVNASKDRKVMEKLQEQQNAAFRKSLARKEAAMLDEIAVLSHGRQGNSDTSALHDNENQRP